VTAAAVIPSAPRNLKARAGRAQTASTTTEMETLIAMIRAAREIKPANKEGIKNLS
jgi:hypothetical protein